MTAPPLVTSCIFKDDMDQGTTQDEKNMRWYDNLEHLEKMEEYRIHDTNHEGFNHNSLNWSLHLLYVHIINMSKTPIIIGVVILMVLCLISSVTYAMMERVNLGMTINVVRCPKWPLPPVVFYQKLPSGRFLPKTPL